MLKGLAAAAAIMALAACTATVRPQPTRIEAPDVSVTIGGSPGGGFCPPGQARKGRC